MKTLLTIAGHPVTLTPHNTLTYLSNACIDCDGSDNRHNDPCWQYQTTLQSLGKPIDAESVPYIVVPPALILSIPGIILGCLAIITNTKTKQTTACVVADVGPRRKLGELSCEAARRIGLSGNPNSGGTSDFIIQYEIYPDVPASIDQTTYRLQPYHSQSQ